MTWAPVEDLTKRALIEEIRALRERLGEDARPAAVSGRNFLAIVELAERAGIDPASLREGVDFDLDAELDERRWASFDRFNELLERVRALRGDPEVRRLGELALDSPFFRAIRVLAGALVTEEEVYPWIARAAFRHDGLLFRGLDVHVRPVRGGTIDVVFEARGEAWFSTAFALAMEGTVGALPLLVSAEPARVVPHTRARRRLVFRTTFAPRPASPISRLALGIRRRRASEELRALYTEMVEANQILHEKLRALEESRAARRALEAELQAHRRSEVLGRFAGTVRHELNNLLTVVSSHAELIDLRMAPDDPHRAELAALGETTERASALVRQLRGFEPGPEEAPPVIDLHDAVEQVHLLLTRLAGPGVELRFERGEAPAPVRIEPGHVEQVLVNLVLNAQEAMPEGGTIQVTSRTADGEALLVVADTGPGMDEATRARVFEPFFSTKDHGHGIGLATVRALAEQHGGAARALSAPGEGARFEVSLPLQPGTEVTPSRPPEGRARPSRPGPAARRVLVIEDNGPVRVVVARLLADAGFEVAAAEHGQAALAQVDEGLRPDVIVSDVLMPGVHGAALAAALRARLGDVPILFVSGFADDALEGVDGPRTDFLAKPFAPGELLVRIEDLLEA